jgi:hypothetical protein
MDLPGLSRCAVNLVAQHNVLTQQPTPTAPAAPVGPLWGSVFLIPLLERLTAKQHALAQGLRPRLRLPEEVMPLTPTTVTPVPLSRHT